MDSDVEAISLLDHSFETSRAFGARNLDAILGTVGEALVRGREGVQVAGR